MMTGMPEVTRRKPPWLNKKIRLGDCADTQVLLHGLRLNTVCSQAACPNIGECFAAHQATFLILGKNCTRACAFCNVRHEAPETVDPGEPRRVADAVRRLGLTHAVITSVTRDDLSDGGALHFAEAIARVRQASPETRIEVLIPDFASNQEAIKTVVAAQPDIIAHNVETVPRFYPAARAQADYRRSLEVLGLVKKFDGAMRTKSGIMLGLGERDGEVAAVMRDLRRVNADYLSIGQYLAPSIRHYPVQEYVAPDIFARYRERGMALGFLYVAAGPYVRSSYRAHEYR